MPDLKVWNGSAFVNGAPKIWNGSAFVNPGSAWIWNGSAFVKVWPSAIEFVSAASASSSTVTMPTHQAGDMIVVFAAREGSSAAPSIPAGYTSHYTGSQASPGAGWCIAYKVATSGSESTGTWTGAGRIGVTVYRNAIALGTPVSQNTIDSSGDIIYPACALDNSDGTSWGLRFAYTSNFNTASTAVPSNVPNTLRYKNTGRILAFDSGGTMSVDLPTGTLGTNAGSDRRTGISLELKQHT